MILQIIGSSFLFVAAMAAPASEAEADPQFFDPVFNAPSAFPQMMDRPMMHPGSHPMAPAGPPMAPGSPAMAPGSPPMGPNMPFGHHVEHGIEGSHDMPHPFVNDPHQMGAHPFPGQISSPDMGMSHPQPQMPMGQMSQMGPNVFNQPFYSLPSNCQKEEEIIMTSTCKPSVEKVCNKEVLQTEKIKYEKVCRDVINTICEGDNMATMNHFMSKREAVSGPEGSADAQYFQGQGETAVAVPSSARSSVKPACREVTTEYCFDSPRVEMIPVELEHCHPIERANCEPAETSVPKITCHPDERKSSMGFSSSRGGQDSFQGQGDDSNQMYQGNQRGDNSQMYQGGQGGDDYQNYQPQGGDSNQMYQGGDDYQNYQSGGQDSNQYQG